VALAVGCKKDATFTEPSPAYAHITWLNAVSDTGQLDVRIIDIPTNASFMDADFRSTLPFPLNIEPGTRHIKVFNSSTVDTIAKKWLLDTSFTFADDQPYSFYLVGFARPGFTPPLHAVITNLTPATPGPGQYAIRVLNLAPSLAGSIRTIPDTTAQPDAFILTNNTFPSGAPAFTNLPFNTPSAYVNVDTGTYRLALTATGTTDPMVVQSTIPPGVVGDPAVGTPGVAGTRIAGSVLTAIIVPRSVPASSAPQTRPSSLRTDTSTSEVSQKITRSSDTVTVQVGSITILTNRRNSSGASRPDSTIARTGTGASSGVTAGGLILVSGATQPEYNGWQQVLSVVDTLICRPSDPGDVVTGSKAKCAPPADTTVASADTARTIFRFRYRIVGAPATPGTGTIVYRLYPANYTASDFATPQIIFVVDKRP
jgi:hypothetical protein